MLTLLKGLSRGGAESLALLGARHRDRERFDHSLAYVHPAHGELVDEVRAEGVPVSCLAVIQGVSLRAVWNRQLQRVLGTAIGMLLAWGLLSLPLDPWRIALLVIVLAFTIETLVVRHYGLAVIFITPLTILLAEAATLGAAPLAELIQSRFIDTLLGCVVGLVGGICLHSPRFREVVGGPMRKLVPRRPAR